MLILHDSPSTDLAHIQAIAEISEGFSLFDYVRITQQDGSAWIGQIVQPNQNISIVGDKLDPTILHGLELMQINSNIRSVESVQIFDLLILGQYEEGQMLTPRTRPLPGSVVTRLNTEETVLLLQLPSAAYDEENNPNVIGELLNADSVPLCISPEIFNYHIMVAGGTGSGKSNVSANLIFQATRYGKCVLVHDAKPDYGFVNRPNTDNRVASIWGRFEPYGLSAQAAANVQRVGFYKACDMESVDVVVGFRASDFNSEMLASLFFTGSSSAEYNAFEAFASATEALRANSDHPTYSTQDILAEVRRRSDPNHPPPNPGDAIHQMTGQSIQRKVRTRLRNMPWMDSVDQPLSSTRGRPRLLGSMLNRSQQRVVETFHLESNAAPGRLFIIDYSQMDEQSYALLLSYFLRVCHSYRKRRGSAGIVQMVDEAHRVFDNESRHSSTLARSFERVMREGRSVDHSIILSLQNASQIPPRVMNNLNSKIVMRQNSKVEADAATQTMGKEFSIQSMRLGVGHALVSMNKSRATVLVQMAPSPFELMRNDNTGSPVTTGTTAEPEGDADDYEF